VVICFVLVVAAVVASLLIDYGLKRHGAFWDKYQKVRIGMKFSEVEEILGPPTSGGDVFEGYLRVISVWREGGREIEVEWVLPPVPKFIMSDPREGGEPTVAYKWLRPKPLVERLLDWVRGS
jgi:hypothetical protein